MTLAGVGFSTCRNWHSTVAKQVVYTLCWQHSGIVFHVVIKNVYTSAIPDEVNNLWLDAAQQDVFLPLSFLESACWEQSDLSTFSFDLEACRETPLSFCHMKKTQCNPVQVNMTSGEDIWCFLSSIMEIYNPSAYLLRVFARWQNLTYINPVSSPARRSSGHYQFVSSFRFPLHYIWIAYTIILTLHERQNPRNICQTEINHFEMACIRFQVVEIINLFDVVACWLNWIGYNLIDLCWNLVLVWVSKFQCGPFVQHTSFKISIVPA